MRRGADSCFGRHCLGGCARVRTQSLLSAIPNSPEPRGSIRTIVTFGDFLLGWMTRAQVLSGATPPKVESAHPPEPSDLTKRCTVKHRGETSPAELDIEIRRVVRRWRIVGGAAAVVIGLVGLAWPEGALKSIALIFGVYLIVVGVLRVSSSLSDPPPRGWKIVQLLFGSVVVIAGVLCLNNPFESLAVLTVVIGVGWILDGAAAILASFVGTRPEQWWAIALGGGISVVAGMVLMAIPYGAIRSFLFVGSVLLVAIGAASLLALVTRSTVHTDTHTPVST
jgi:uncharacterized membrane protein HdeD (DUF308 family)